MSAALHRHTCPKTSRCANLYRSEAGSDGSGCNYGYWRHCRAVFGHKHSGTGGESVGFHNWSGVWENEAVVPEGHDASSQEGSPLTGMRRQARDEACLRVEYSD